MGFVRRREGVGLDEVLEDRHKKEDGDEDGRGREAEGDGVHGRAEVPERRRLGVRGGGRLGRRQRGLPCWPWSRLAPKIAHGSRLLQFLVV